VTEARRRSRSFEHPGIEAAPVGLLGGAFLLVQLLAELQQSDGTSVDPPSWIQGYGYVFENPKTTAERLRKLLLRDERIASELATLPAGDVLMLCIGEESVKAHAGSAVHGPDVSCALLTRQLAILRRESAVRGVARWRGELTKLEAQLRRIRETEARVPSPAPGPRPASEREHPHATADSAGDRQAGVAGPGPESPPDDPPTVDPTPSPPDDLGPIDVIPNPLL
jgi:hypothetical protein